MSADQSQTKAKAREPDVDLTLWDSDQEISLSQKATFNDKWCQPTKDAGESDAKPVTTSSSVRKSSADIKKGSSGTGKKSTSTSSDTATSNRSQKLLSSSDQAKKSVRALQAPPVCTTLRGSQGQPIVLDSDDETTSEQAPRSHSNANGGARPKPSPQATPNPKPRKPSSGLPLPSTKARGSSSIPSKSSSAGNVPKVLPHPSIRPLTSSQPPRLHQTARPNPKLVGARKSSRESIVSTSSQANGTAPSAGPARVIPRSSPPRSNASLPERSRNIEADQSTRQKPSPEISRTSKDARRSGSKGSEAAEPADGEDALRLPPSPSPYVSGQPDADPALEDNIPRQTAPEPDSDPTMVRATQPVAGRDHSLPAENTTEGSGMPVVQQISRPSPLASTEALSRQTEPGRTSARADERTLSSTSIRRNSSSPHKSRHNVQTKPRPHLRKSAVHTAIRHKKPSAPGSEIASPSSAKIDKPSIKWPSNDMATVPVGTADDPADDMYLQDDGPMSKVLPAMEHVAHGDKTIDPDGRMPSADEHDSLSDGISDQDDDVVLESKEAISKNDIAAVISNHIDSFRVNHQDMTMALLRQSNRQRARAVLPRASGARPFTFSSMPSSSVSSHHKSLSTWPIQHLSEDENSETNSQQTYICTGRPIPSFKLYTPLRTAYLSQNVKRLNIDPVNVSGKVDEAQFMKDIKHRYHLDEFKLREHNGFAKQQARQMSTYLEAALRDIKFDMLKLLRYLLDYQAHVGWIPKEVKHYIEQKGQFRTKWAKLLLQLPPFSEQEIDIANTICQAYYNCERVSIWYFVRHYYDTTTKQLPSVGQASKLWSTSRCRICHIHHCLEHGEYREELPASDADSCSSSADQAHTSQPGSDDEDPSQINHRLVIRPRFSDHTKAVSLAYRWSNLPQRSTLISEQARDLVDFPGLDADDSGEDELLSFESSGCSERCFWIKQNRTALPYNSWTAKEKADLRNLLIQFGSSKRGPCLIAMAMTKPCIEVFVEMLRAAETIPSVDEGPERPVTVLPKHPWYLVKEPTLANKRAIFIPCSHDGECDEECSCHTENVPCEKTCRCYPHCARQWQGCRCKRQGKTCGSTSCLCWRYNRECDEDLCGTCGADEALNPLNGGKELERVCSNVAMQRGSYKRTLVGISGVAGLGLFAAEEMKASDLIGEYKGEILAEEESSRRGQIYSHSGAFYEFTAGESRIIDATTAGNKMRFMNNAHSENIVNVASKVMICNSVVKLGFYASRDIGPGEELFFDYGIHNEKDLERYNLFEKSADGTFVKLKRHQLAKIVQTKVRKASKKRPKSSGLLGSVKGGSVDTEAFDNDSLLSDGATSDVDPMQLDIGTIRVEDPDDTDYMTDRSDAGEGSSSRATRNTRARAKTRASAMQSEASTPRETSRRRSTRTLKVEDLVSEDSSSKVSKRKRRRSSG